jgi:hypothetical protein
VGESCDDTPACACSPAVRVLGATSRDPRQGDRLVIEVELLNVGEAQATYDLAFTVNEINVLETRKGVRVPANGRAILQFNATALAPFESLHASASAFPSSGRGKPQSSEVLTVQVRPRRLTEHPVVEYLAEFKEFFEIAVALVTVVGLFLGYRSLRGRTAGEPVAEARSEYGAYPYYPYYAGYDSYYAWYASAYPSGGAYSPQEGGAEGAAAGEAAQVEGQRAQSAAEGGGGGCVGVGGEGRPPQDAAPDPDAPR